jgi:hypothetical protein
MHLVNKKVAEFYRDRRRKRPRFVLHCLFRRTRLRLTAYRLIDKLKFSLTFNWLYTQNSKGSRRPARLTASFFLHPRLRLQYNLPAVIAFPTSNLG